MIFKIILCDTCAQSCKTRHSELRVVAITHHTTATIKTHYQACLSSKSLTVDCSRNQ